MREIRRFWCGLCPTVAGLQRSEQSFPTTFVVPTVATSVDLVVHLAMDASGRRRVREITAVTGRVEGDVIETSDIFATRHGRLERAEGFPPHPERYEAAGIDVAAVLGQRAELHAAQG